MFQHSLRWLMICLVAAGSVQLAGAATIQAKAALAPVLIERAWVRSLEQSRLGEKPWPWADTHPVARVRFPAQSRELLVLAGDSGNALAFGPGYALTSAELGGHGVAVIGGHRDTHFHFLREVAPGAEVHLELVDGSTQRYRITHRQVVDDSGDLALMHIAEAALLFVTCYPFDTLAVGGSLRYVVTALPITDRAQHTPPATPAALAAR